MLCIGIVCGLMAVLLNIVRMYLEGEFDKEPEDPLTEELYKVVEERMGYNE